MSIILREPGVSKDSFKGRSMELNWIFWRGGVSGGFINQETFMARDWIYCTMYSVQIDVFRNNAVKKL